MQWFLRFRVFIIISIAVLLITAAVLFSAVRAVLPYATGYKNEIQQEISEQIGLPVEIGSIDAEIYWFTPRLKLIDVIVYDDQHDARLFDFKEAFVGLDVLASILRREIIVDDIGLVRADIFIEKLSESEWLIQGIKFTSEGSSEVPDQLVYMIKNSDYLLHDSNIYYQDHTGDKLNLKLLDVNVDVRNDFNSHDIRFSMKLPEAYGESLVVLASVRGDARTLEGDIYVEAKQIDVRQWKTKFKLLEEFLIDAVVDVDLWLTLDKSKIQSLLTRFSSEKIKIKNQKTNRSWASDYLSSNLRFGQDGEYRNIAISDFYFGGKDRPDWGRPVNVLVSDDKDSYYFSADMLRYSDVINIANVFASEKQLKDLAALTAYEIHTDVYNINLQLAKDFSTDNILKDLTLEASISDFSMIDNDIKVDGFDATVLIEEEKISVDIAAQDVSVELTELFRGPISATTVNGELSLQQQENNWLISTERLQLNNNHIKTFSRFNLRVTPEKELFVDAQTNFFDAYGKYATHYLPVGIMSSELVDWLDMAVTDGYVPQGTFILQGNLSDFPYEQNNGIFQVLFSAENVSLKFLENWPILENVDARIKFVNQSLYLTDARGRTLQSSLFNGHAEILDLSRPLLTVKTSASGLNEDAQDYVWKSPLNDVFGDALRLFQFDGESELALILDVPLYAEEVDVKIDGHLNFINSALYYPALGYEVSGINGVIDFTGDSIFADTIKANIQNNPVLINAFTQNGGSGPEVVFHLDGLVSTDYLLQRYEWIPEDWVSGQSNWSVDIEIPNEAKDYLVHVKASSYLEDVVFAVSDKVSKSENSPLALALDIDILPDTGLYVEATLNDRNKKSKKIDNVVVSSDADDANLIAADSEEIVKNRSSELINLFATRDEENIWKFDIKSEYMRGKGEFTEGLAKDTSISLNMENIDVHALFVSENEQASKPLLPSDFPPLNWKAKKVIWDEWVFSDVIVETDWHKHGMLINKLILGGHEMKFNARGTWLTSWRGTHETVLQGNVSSNNFGATLSGLGFQRSIDRAKFSATFNSKWPAEPYGLSWANMKGKTSFEMKDGEIIEVDPGTGGRLLGLLNIFRLTNRLAFDFDDVYRKGFSFDSIKGDFEFLNGAGSMKKFEVSAPAADMTMFGSIGMVKHDYGLLMRVKPHTDTLTFAGGALLGGVVVGAGLALVQKVFDLGVIGHNVYSITGTWDDPVIEKIVEKTADTNEDDDF